ncbi:hypothetical protein [Saccharothrix obliqua]|uniref:hypothetical protein n=1 Tax=Saccharothrix obliqua TaxID=2861747 RepID=UPI001C5D1908|nr:hypothetical protein [Saccharothrix obliqua]MBW4719181.1 hypothetical protein [Saccharothrix obliqua]
MPYVWWHSECDSLCHAFSTQQVVVDRYEAACMRYVPPDLLLREATGPLCVPCLLRVGQLNRSITIAMP